MKQLIASIFHEHRDVIGTGGSIVSFRKEVLFSGKTVRKLMQQLGLKSPPEEIPVLPGNIGLAAENILQRQFKASS